MNDTLRAAAHHETMAVIEGAHPKQGFHQKVKVGVKVKMVIPTQPTLKKYGLTEKDFKQWLEIQNNICPICEKTPKTGKWNIDHDHKPNWKKLPPEERKKHVRGVVCWFCNTYYLGKAISIRKSENVTNYLRRHETRNSG